jgi:hypothetical protein
MTRLPCPRSVSRHRCTPERLPLRRTDSPARRSRKARSRAARQCRGWRRWSCRHRRRSEMDRTGWRDTHQNHTFEVRHCRTSSRPDRRKPHPRRPRVRRRIGPIRTRSRFDTDSAGSRRPCHRSSIGRTQACRRSRRRQSRTGTDRLRTEPSDREPRCPHLSSRPRPRQRRDPSSSSNRRRTQGNRPAGWHKAAEVFR